MKTLLFCVLFVLGGIVNVNTSYAGVTGSKTGGCTDCYYIYDECGDVRVDIVINCGTDPGLCYDVRSDGVHIFGCTTCTNCYPSAFNEDIILDRNDNPIGVHIEIDPWIVTAIDNEIITVEED